MNEQRLAANLLTELSPDMLVLADRGFYSYDLWHDARSRGAQLLLRQRQRQTSGQEDTSRRLLSFIFDRYRKPPTDALSQRRSD